MFIRLSDAKANVDLLISIKEILAVKDYIANPGNVIANCNAVIMTRPMDPQVDGTHNYFVVETLTEIERLIDNAIERMY